MGDLPRQPDFELILRIVEELHCDGCVRRRLTRKLRRLLRRHAPRLLTSYDIRARLGNAVPRRPRKPQMNECECDVAVLIYQGKSNSQIAKKLGKSIKTVACQVSALLRKFRVKGRVLFARRFGVHFGKGYKDHPAIPRKPPRSHLPAFPLPPLLLPFVQEACGSMEFLV